MADKPHIVINAKGGPGWLGGRQYSINLLRALLAYRGDTDAYDVSVLVRGEEELVHYEPLRPSLRVCSDYHALLQDFTLVNRIRWKIKQLFFGWLNPRYEEPLVAMGATFVYPFSGSRVPSADWISDFQYSYYPDRMSADEIGRREKEFGDIVDAAQRIVLSSQSAERDCHRLFPSALGRTDVLQFRVFSDPAWTVEDPAPVVAKYHLPERFGLISNWLLPTKNHGLVLDALALIPEEKRAGIHIVCTGDLYDYRNPGFYNPFLNRIHTLGLSAHVSVLGVIPKSDQIQLLRAATGYVQPSLFEGWNTGVEEARMFGKAMVVSDIPVHREQEPPRSAFFDPHDASDLAAKLLELFAPGAKGFDPVVEREAFVAYEALQAGCGRTILEICKQGGGNAPHQSH